MADRRSSTGSILQRNTEYGTILAVDSDALRPLSSKALALSAFFVLFTPFLVVAVTEYLKAREFEGLMMENSCVVVNVTWFEEAYRWSIVWEVNVFVKNRTENVDIIPGEILERVVKQFEAQDYASDKPIGYSGVCYLGFLEGDGEEVVMWKLPRSDFPLAATICLVAVNSILLLLIIFFSVKHWLRRAKAREARRREKAVTQRLLRGLNTPPDLDADTD